MRTRRWSSVGACLAAVAVCMVAPTVSAQESAAPKVTVDRAAVRPGEAVVVTLTGWSAEVITLSVCGNQAARGSTDCNMIASEGIRRNRDGSTTRRDFVVLAPDTTCPCVLRASTTTNDEVAVTPIELIGHPTGPIVLSKTQPGLEVVLRTRKDSGGLLGGLRSALGGPTAYAVTVSVRNVSSLQLDHVVVRGAAKRRGGDVAPLEFPAPGPIGPGQEWTHTMRSTVPAPAVGTFAWEVTASGAGPSAHAEAAVQSRPFGLVVVVLLLAADLLAIAWTRIERRRAVASGDGGAAGSGRDGGFASNADDTEVGHWADPELVGAPW